MPRKRMDILIEINECSDTMFRGYGGFHTVMNIMTVRRATSTISVTFQLCRWCKPAIFVINYHKTSSHTAFPP